MPATSGSATTGDERGEEPTAPGGLDTPVPAGAVAEDTTVGPDAVAPERAALAMFWELSTELLSIAEPGGRFLHVNPAWTRALGWSRRHLLQTNALDLVHPDDIDSTSEVLARLVTGGTHVENFENRYRTADGDHRVLRWNSRAGMDGRVYSVTRDVTRLVEGERRLLESEERFRLSMAHAAIGMALVGLDGEFVEVNDALCVLVGRPRDVLTTMTFQDITHPDDLHADLVLVGSLAAGEIDRYDLEKRYLRPDGSIVWAQLSGAVMRDESGQPRYYIAQMQDITARKAAERELVLTLEDLQRSNETLTDFAAIAAHDLKSPLVTSISGLELLSMRFAGSLPAQGQELLDRARAQLTWLSRQIDGLLRVAAMSGMPLDLDEVELGELVDRVVDGLGRLLDGLDIAVGACPTVRGDRSALTVLLQNLVENAARHGASRLRLHCETVTDAEGMVRLLLDDNGPGIPEHEREEVFELFHRGAGSRGGGLGLATCRRIVDRHGGDIGVDDAPDGGARIWFTLPRA